MHPSTAGAAAGVSESVIDWFLVPSIAPDELRYFMYTVFTPSEHDEIPEQRSHGTSGDDGLYVNV
jgi:hypothetical protein